MNFVAKNSAQYKQEGRLESWKGGEGQEGLLIDEKSCLAIGHVEPSHRDC